MLGNVINSPDFRLVHAYWQKTEHVLKCSFFPVRMKASMKIKGGDIHCAKRSLWTWGFNLSWILLNITSVLLVSPTKVWAPNVVLKRNHVLFYWWNALSHSFITNIWNHTVHGTIMGPSLSLTEFFENNVMVYKEKLFSWSHKDPQRKSIIEIFLLNYKAMQKSRTFVKLFLEDIRCVSLVWK